jgi:hypothetical protein
LSLRVEFGSQRRELRVIPRSDVGVRVGIRMSRSAEGGRFNQ